MFKIKYPIDCGYKFIIDKFVTKELEYVGKNEIKIWEQKQKESIPLRAD